ncbi:MAG: Gfo/Idh/MocA family oxidoreductase [Acidobacteriia bacterium]|nr:Gfo/Idh/MocA family oxidoreductase [Terriglobia bacterium]
MATSGRVGYAVVGLGHFGEHVVLPGFRNSRKAKLVALVSGDERKARRLAGKFGASDYYDYGDYALCLNHPHVDAVYIASNNSTHAEFTVKAAAAGKHVLCEKPMANSIEECQQMIDACRANHVRLMIAYRKYFEPASLDLKMLVERGKLGRLKIIHSAFSIYLRPGPKVGRWHFDRRLAGGGALPDVGVYCINTALWVAGKQPLEAAAYQWTADPEVFSEVDEHVAFRLNFPDGLVMQATASWGAAPASFLHVIGEKGCATLDPAFEYDEERRLYGRIGGRWFEKRYKVMNELALELDGFADCVRRNREPEPNGTVGLRDVAVMQAIYRAAREGRPVPIGG